MQNILIPTDFSPIAENAIDYAIDLAKEFKSQIFLFHFYTFDRYNYDYEYPKHNQPYVKRLEKKIKSTKLKFTEKLKEYGLSMHTIVEQGNVSALIKSKVEKFNIDLIVMGTKGATGINKVVFGSVAASVMENASLPVLVVPPGHSLSRIEHIVLGIDSQPFQRMTVELLEQVAIKYGSRVTMLYVNPGSSNKQIRREELNLNDIEFSLQEIPITSSIGESITLFAENENCDLLCLIRRSRGFFQSLFQKSVTKSQVLKSNFPLLILPENKN